MLPLPTLRQLEYVVALAELRSFHGAARATHVSQPGLSAQIRAVEALLGVRLFERDRRPVLVTPAGAALLPRARAALAEVRGLVEAAQAQKRPLEGPLRMGVIPTVAPFLLPRVLPRVRRRHPRLALRLHEAPTRALVALLEAGELDVLLLALEAPLEGLATLALFEEPFVVALPAGHRLASRKHLGEADLRGEPVLLLDDAHCLRAQAIAACRSAPAHEMGDFRATSLPTLVEMVAGGAGFTLLPESAARVERRRSDLALVPFSPPAPFRTIGFAWRPSSGRAAELELLAASFGPPTSGAPGR